MQFSQIPHFILEEYIRRAHIPQDEKEEGTSSLINPDFIFKDRNDKVNWQDTTGFTWSGVVHDTWFNDSYLLGPRTTIKTTEEGMLLELYIKDDTGFHPIRILTRENNEGRERFFFTHIQNLNFPQELYDTIQEEHYNEDDEPYWSYTFEIYDLWRNRIDIGNGTPLYIRKDSIFHQWMENNAEKIFNDKYDIDFITNQYLNTEKPFVYLGDIYSNTKGNMDQYYFIYYNIYHFVVNSIPEHQRTSKFLDYLYMAFDMLYNRSYQSQKNIWSMIDPIEADSQILDFIGTYQGMNFDPLRFSINRKRWFIKNLTDFLKTKGTYTSLYTIWKYISQSNNRLNIYERWHDKAISGDVAEDDYIDYLHTSFYDETDYDTGAGEAWYKKYFDDSDYPEDFDTNRLSTQYIVEADLTSMPVEYDEILAKGTIQSLYNLWEEFRPITRTSKYKLMISPITDLSGSNTSLYSRELIPYLDTRSLLTLSDFDEGASGISIEFFTSNSTTIQHGLNTKRIMVELYDGELKRVNDDKIEKIELVSDNRIEIELSEEIPGGVYSIIKKGDFQEFSYLEEAGEDSGSKHPYNTIDLVTTFYQGDYVVNPKNVMLEGNDSIYHWTPSITKTVAYPADLRVNGQDSDIWEIQHNLGCDAIIFDVYNEDHHKIYPDKVKIVDKDNIRMEFNKPVTGEVKIVKVGEIDGPLHDKGTFISENTTDEFIIEHNYDSNMILVHVYSTDLERISPRSIQFLDSNTLKVTLKETVDTYTFIKAITPADKHSYALDDYTWAITTLDGNIDYFTYTTEWYNDNEVREPEYVKISDTNRIMVNDDNVNRVVFCKRDYEQSFIDTSTDIWNINHNLEALGLIVNTYNKDWERITPENIEVMDINNIRITFSENQEGYVLISKVGNPSFEWIRDRLEGSVLLVSSVEKAFSDYVYHNPSFGLPTDPSDGQKFISSGTANGWNEYYIYEWNKDGYEWIQLYDDSWVQEININKFRDEEDFLYLEYSIPEDFEMDIREFTIRDDSGLLVNSNFSNLSKIEGIEMNVFFRISKARLQ